LTLLDPGTVAGACGILAGSICLLALRRHRIIAEKTQSEFRSLLHEQKAECFQQIAQLDRNMAVLELSAQNIDDACNGGFTRALRSQAMQLLRSGMSPEIAASTLGIGRREMRLIARVSHTLSLK
jgi:hypothetical protein